MKRYLFYVPGFTWGVAWDLWAESLADAKARIRRLFDLKRLPPDSSVWPA
jgi:hypothetical protein